MAAVHRSFTSFQMVHTHASLPRGFFLFAARLCSYRCPDHGWRKPKAGDSKCREDHIQILIQIARKTKLVVQIRHCSHSMCLISQCLSCSCQMAGKVGQIFWSKDLNRMSWKIFIRVFQSLQDATIAIPVSVENVPKERSQLVDLHRWGIFHLRMERVRVFHVWYGDVVVLFEIPPSGVLLRRNFRNLVMSTPVIRQKTRLGPWVDPSISACSDMSYDAIEEVLRLAVPMDSISIHFCDHQVTFRRRIVILIWMTDFIEVLSMQLSPWCIWCVVQRMPVWQGRVLDRENWGLMSGISCVRWSWSWLDTGGEDGLVCLIVVRMDRGCGPSRWGWIRHVWSADIGGLVLGVIVGIGKWVMLTTMSIGRHGWCGETSGNRVTFSHVTAGARKRAELRD